MHTNLQSYLAVLRKEKELIEISAEVDPYLEAAEIHRRVVAEEGPALLFTNIKGANFPLVTNLFGNKKRIDLSFGKRPENLIREFVKLPETLVSPSLGALWSNRGVLFELTKMGTKKGSAAPVLDVVKKDPELTRLPLLTTWEQDGGPFITLPLVYSEHPETHIHNLGMYRMQRYDDTCTGLHCQIGKGGGFHMARAKELGQKLPVHVHIGGPPALMLSAIAPLPENVPELLLASFMLGQKISTTSSPLSPLPIISEAEFVLMGEVDPSELRPEGPFGDHYGYYSLKHDYPVFRCKALAHRKGAVFTATVVGKPKQEDFYLGDYLQELLSPIFPLTMPAVVDLWSYGETGYHSLAGAVVKQRYKREAMASAFRILGEGQLSLTKFLLVTDKRIDLKNFPKTLEHILARTDFRSDLFIFSNLSMDTLDYTGPKINEGSKGVLLGVGDPIRDLPSEFKGPLAPGVKSAKAFCPGCLVISGPEYGEDREFGSQVLKSEAFDNWPLIVLVDDVEKSIKTPSSFLWTTFTRFEPANDIKSKSQRIERNHIQHDAPILIDARMKSWYPDELFCDEKTEKLVSNRWREYFRE